MQLLINIIHQKIKILQKKNQGIVNIIAYNIPLYLNISSNYTAKLCHGHK